MANSLLSRLYLHPCSRRGMRALMSSADFNVCLAAESLTRRGFPLMSIKISERRDELAVLEDHQLVALVRTREGNFQDAAVVLTKRLNGFLTSMICSVSRFQSDDLADVIQQTWIRAFSPGAEQFSTAPEFRSWLKTVAKSRSLDMLRRRSHRSIPEDADIVLPVATENPTSVALEKCLQELETGRPEFAVVIRGICGGRSGVDLSTELGISQNTVYSRFDRSRKLLKECMERRLA
jgi:RNA polymerase sigma factor (sigma-70 family)